MVKTIMLMMAAFLLSAAAAMAADETCVMQLKPGSYFNLDDPEFMQQCDKPKAAGGLWGAVAVSDTNLAWGYGKDYAARSDAEARAIKECAVHARDCKVAISASNSCQALATSVPGRAWGAQWMPQGQDATALALSRCRKEGGSNCIVQFQFCAGG